MAQINDKTVVCLKWGNSADGVYSSEWVNRLQRSLERYLSPPFRLVCFTDDPAGLDASVDARDIETLAFSPQLRDVWWKLALMHPKAGLRGRCLFLDLDVVITGSLDDFFAMPGDFCIIRNWIERRKQILRRLPPIGNSSVFRFEAGKGANAAELFLQDPQNAFDNYPTEQAFMTNAIGLQNIRWWPESWVRSFKRHCLPVWPVNLLAPPRMPEGARIIAFHGYPKQHTVIKGARERGRYGKYFSLPWPKLGEYWQ